MVCSLWGPAEEQEPAKGAEKEQLLQFPDTMSEGGVGGGAGAAVLRWGGEQGEGVAARPGALWRVWLRWSSSEKGLPRWGEERLRGQKLEITGQALGSERGCLYCSCLYWSY